MLLTCSSLPRRAGNCAPSARPPGGIQKYIEKDPALTRRFQTVQVHEPDEAKAVLMLRSTVSPLETHHQVLLLDEAVSAAVKLSHRYIPARQLPDKAVALLDTACARVAVSQSAPPAQLEDCLRHWRPRTWSWRLLNAKCAWGRAIRRVWRP